MQTSVRIVVGHADEAVREAIVRLLGHRHEIAALCATCRHLVESARAHEPNLIVSGAEFTDGDGLAALVEIGREQLIPSVLVTSGHSDRLAEPAVVDHVMAFLNNPLRAVELEAAILLASARHAQLVALRTEIEALRNALADRKVIEKAKGSLMSAERLTEGEAFGRLRRSAQDNRRRIIDEAREVLRTLGKPPLGAPSP